MSRAEILRAIFLPFLALLSLSPSAHAQATLTPSTLPFGNQALNEASVTKTATLKNTQSVSLNINSIAPEGADPGDFALGGTCPNSGALAAGKTCTITVTFTPLALGSRSATLTVTDDASNSPQTVSLTGAGVEPATLSLATLTFGNVAEGTTSATRTETLTNNQLIVLNISSISAGGDFAVSGGTCPASGSLKSKGTCTIFVTLTPTIVGPESGTLTVMDGTSNSPQTAALTGTGIIPVKLSVTSENFGTVYVGNASGTRTVVLTNEENVALPFTNISASGNFSIVTNTCGTSVPAARTCDIGLQFLPAGTGVASGTLSFTDSAVNSPQNVTLSGTGATPVTVAPTSLAFPSIVVGKTSAAKVVTLTNHLSTTLTIPNPMASGDFAISSNTCTTPVAAGKTCAIDVTFTPTANGTRTGTLTIPYEAFGSPAAVNLTGTGEGGDPPSLSITTTSLPNGRTGVTYSAALAATGGTTPYTWSLVSGALPAGLSLADSSGAITGTPTATVVQAPLTFEVTDSSSPPLEQTANLTMTVGTAQSQLITLSANGSYLVNTFTNQPVFLVGDDAFDLAVMLDSPQVTTYLSDRASRGFNAIWVAAVDNGYSPNPPHNAAGNTPFDGADFTSEDSAYWSYLDSVINEAAQYGITVFLNPFFPGNGDEPGYLSSVLASSDATMSAYGSFIGSRYASYDNIVWLLGGDSWPSSAGLYQKLNDVGAAIASADPNHLITLEGCEMCADNGYNSVQAYQAQSLPVPAWLGLDWAYPQLTTTLAAAQNAYLQTPFLPPVCGENFYELEHSMTELDVRFEQYSEVLSGCYLGRIFGNGAIWSFDSPNGSTCCRGGSPTWENELSSTGSVSQEYQGRLFDSREHWLLVPDINHTVVTAGYGSGLTMTTAARTSGGQTVIAYIPNGDATTITVAMSQITSASNTVQGWWFNPSTAATTNLGTFPNSGTHNFTPPSSADWVLVLDDASAGLPAPASSQ